jgi:D-arginine dehydrogenase
MTGVTPDIVVVGGGMAGLSIAAILAGQARVLVLEAEDVPGYHATGRSVAFWTESYGGPLVQPLTTASGPMLRKPDAAFSKTSFLNPRGALHIGRSDDAAAAAEMLRLYGGRGVAMHSVERAALAQAVPGLRPEWTVGVAEPSCMDIDAAALLEAYRRQLIRSGGELRCGARATSARRDGAGWRVEAEGGAISCAIVVNAGGAWADSFAQASGVAPVGITPLRRTVVQLRTDPPVPDDLPLVIDLAGQFYFKGVGNGRLWLTPHDEVPDVPGDAAPDELAVATAIDRLHAVVDWRVAAVERKWAGLRSFAPDRAPVYGFDPLAPGFFWFAGQGGFGIQTAPAAALIGAALATGSPLPADVAHIDAALYSPDRFDL